MSRSRLQLQAPYQPRGDQPSAISKLVSGFEAGLAKQVLLGVTGSGKTFTMANILSKLQRPGLILAPNKTLAAQLYAEMRAFFPKNAVEYFVSYYDYYQPEAYVPTSDTYIEKDAAINEQIEQMRLSATKALLERKDTIIVATVSAIYGLGDPKSYMHMLLHLSCGEEIAMQKILRRLAELQYVRNDTDFRRGTYRVQGDFLDIFPASSEKEALRVSFFDTEIEYLRLFDPITGKALRNLPRFTIFPKTHYATPRKKLLEAIEFIKAELKTRLSELYAQNKLVEAQRLEQRTRFDLEMILELGYCTGIENYSRYLSGRSAGEPPPTLMDYLSDDTLIILDESHMMVPQLTAMYRGDRARKENLVNYGFRLPSALDNRPLTFAEFEHLASCVLFVSATPADYELEISDQLAEQVVRPTGLLDPQIFIRPQATQVDDLLSEIRLVTARQERVLVTTLTKRMAENLSDYLTEHGIKVRYLHSDIDTIERVQLLQDLRQGIFDVLVGINLLREGLDIPEVALVAILDADKEGFLRSERALIQTIGRAARNVHGTVILYADRTTKSMQKAIDETKRRRATQMAFNQRHQITPKTVSKKVALMLQTAADITADHPATQTDEIAQTIAHYRALTPKVLAQKIKKLETQMHQYAENLEFEKAAHTRDLLAQLKKLAFLS